MSDLEQKIINIRIGLNIRTALFIAAMPLIIFSSYRISEGLFAQKTVSTSVAAHSETAKKTSQNLPGSDSVTLEPQHQEDDRESSTKEIISEKDEIALQEYKKRMEAMTNQAAINESKKTVDISQIKDSHSSIEYKGVVFNKIGFMSDGSTMSAEKKKAQVKETYKTLIEKGDNWFVKFPAKGKEIAGIFVFSDPTCGFCKKLHNAIPELNSKGITVNYLMYPRMLALGSNNENVKSVIGGFRGAWCSTDRADGFNRLYSGQLVSEAGCKTETPTGKFPLFEHYFFGQLFNVQGTPAFFSSTGVAKEGFSTADKLINQIMENK